MSLSLLSFLKQTEQWLLRRRRARKLAAYKRNGRTPWSQGYDEFKWDFIAEQLADEESMRHFTASCLPEGYGISLDERVVEYPWIFTRLNSPGNKWLDAGSTFNYPVILDYEPVRESDLTIFTYHPERHSYNKRRISYVYGDLRKMPFRDEWFDVIVCQSTLEHIDMDNSIYGYGDASVSGNRERNFEFLNAALELQRILARGGQLLLTVPYGAFEHHGSFQQFDAGMIDSLVNTFAAHGRITNEMLLYRRNGWTFAKQEECDKSTSYNPRTGANRGDDNAAHCRAIYCLHFQKE